MTIKQQQIARLRSALGDEVWKYLEEETMKPYTSWEDLPTCPYCGEEDQDWSDGLEPKNAGYTWNVECCACGRDYRVILRVDASFKSEVMV